MSRVRSLTPTETMYLGIFFLLIGLAIAYFGSADTKLNCSKSSNLCTVEKTNIWIFKDVKHIALSDLIEAQVENTGFSRRQKHSRTQPISITNVVLLTKIGKIPLASSDIIDWAEQDSDCQKINNFLNTDEKNLEIVYPGFLIIKLLGLFFVFAGVQIIRYKNGVPEKPSTTTNFIWAIGFLLVGLAMLYFLGLDTKFSCTRSANMCTIEKTNISGFKDNKYIYLSELTGAESKPYKGPYRNTTINSYKVVLLTKKEEIPLSSVSPATHTFFELLQVPSPNSFAFNNMDYQKINQYIHSQDEKLDIAYSTTIIRIIGLVLVGFGLLALVPEQKQLK